MDLSSLNSEQQKIILDNKGPILVIAGPGTGKTYTIVKKIIYLLVEKKLSPNSILVTTFTNKAANELKYRISFELKKLNVTLDVSQLKIGTIHSICLQILNQRNITIIDDFEQKLLIYKNIKIFSKEKGYTTLIKFLESLYQGTVGNFQHLFNILSENLILPSKLKESNDNKLITLGNIYSRYLDIISKHNILDFSQIQRKCLYILNDDPKLLESLKNEIKYIIVDEFQDTNNIQTKIILKLCNEQNNICVVGDDDQSIYRFRGANVQNILNFRHNFEVGKCKTYFLSENYRSTAEIISFYSNFMNSKLKDEDRHNKNLISKSKFSHPSIFKFSENSSQENITPIVLTIRKLLNDKIISDLNQIAFLFKSTKSSEAKIISKGLIESGIPVFSPRSGEFFKKDEIKLIVGLALSFYKEFSIELYKKKSLHIHEKYYKNCISFLKEQLNSDKCNEEFKSWIKSYSIEEKESFISLYYKTMNFKFISDIFSESHSETIVEKDKKKQLQKNISIILNSFSNYEKKHNTIFDKNFFYNYFPFLFECGINEFEDENEVNLEGHISFLTFHQAKGLEFPVVFLGSLDAFPKKYEKNKILDEINKQFIKKENYNFYKDELHDIYRIFYTGFSRAKNFLFLIAREKSVDDSNFSNSPSEIFIETLSPLRDYNDFLNYEFNISIPMEKEAKNKPKFSYTNDIALYLECPRKYKFFKSLNFPQRKNSSLLIGNFVHSSIDSLLKLSLKYPEKEISEKEIKTILKSNYEFLRINNGFILDHEKAKECLNTVYNYYQKEKNNFHRIFGTEIQLTTINREFIITGILDCLITKKNESSLEGRPLYEIIDFKTNTIKPDFIPENYEKQLLIYWHLAHNNGYNVDSLKLYYTNYLDNPILDIEFSDNKLHNTISEFNFIASKILKKEFASMTSDKNICKKCELLYYCYPTKTNELLTSELPPLADKEVCSANFNKTI